jgi:hypothetical protein
MFFVDVLRVNRLLANQLFVNRANRLLVTRVSLCVNRVLTFVVMSHSVRSVDSF